MLVVVEVLLMMLHIQVVQVVLEEELLEIIIIHQEVVQLTQEAELVVQIIILLVLEVQVLLF
jgi:hypothetical protein